MKTIDLHNHMIPPDVVSFLEREGEHYATQIVEREGRRVVVIEDSATRPLNEPMTDPKARLRDMDALHVDVQAVSCVPFVMYPNVDPALGLAVAQVNNDALADVSRKHPGRLVPVGTVPLQDPPAAVRELERARALGMRALQIPPKVGDQGLDEAQFEPFWEAAEALHMPLIIHPFEAAPQGVFARYGFGNFVGNLYDTGLAAALLIFGGVLERHPGLRVVLCHAGGTLPGLLGRLDNGYRLLGARAPISRLPSTFVDQFWFDVISFNPAMLRYLAQTYGADRLVLGSDYPLGGGLADPVAEVKSLGLSPDDEQLILGGNAGQLLGLA